MIFTESSGGVFVNIKFSEPGNYLIFRAIRFPVLMNPYSLSDESFAQTELRKISRQKGKPTRIYKKSNKDGNIKRSGTLVVPFQHLFGSVGYALTKKDLNNTHHFSRNMDIANTGYGKNRNYNNIDGTSVKSKINDYLNNTSKYPRRDINEIVLDIKSPKDISFVYYTIDRSRYVNKDGMETNSIDSRKLSAIFLQKEIEKKSNITVPIYEYTRTQRKLKLFEYSQQELKELLTDAFLYRSNNRNLLPIATTFKDTIKSDPYLLKTVKSNLSWQVFKFRFGFYNNYYELDRSFKTTHINQPIFNINCLIKLSKTLKEYDLDRKSTYVAKETLKTILNSYASKESEIFTKRPKCTHQDIHERNFKMFVKECKNLLPPNEFNNYSKSIKNTLKLIREFSMQKKLSENNIIKNKAVTNKVEPYM